VIPPSHVFAPQCAGEPSPGLLVADLFGEVDHVLVPDPARQRLDLEEVLPVVLVRAVRSLGRYPVSPVRGSDSHSPSQPSFDSAWVSVSRSTTARSSTVVPPYPRSSALTALVRMNEAQGGT